MAKYIASDRRYHLFCSACDPLANAWSIHTAIQARACPRLAERCESNSFGYALGAIIVFPSLSHLSLVDAHFWVYATGYNWLDSYEPSKITERALVDDLEKELQFL